MGQTHHDSRWLSCAAKAETLWCSSDSQTLVHIRITWRANSNNSWAPPWVSSSVDTKQHFTIFHFLSGDTFIDFVVCIVLPTTWPLPDPLLYCSFSWKHLPTAFFRSMASIFSNLCWLQTVRYISDFFSFEFWASALWVFLISLSFSLLHLEVRRISRGTPTTIFLDPYICSLKKNTVLGVRQTWVHILYLGNSLKIWVSFSSLVSHGWW